MIFDNISDSYIMQLRTVLWQMNDEMERIWKKASMA
jgi:hypothetical protein